MRWPLSSDHWSCWCCPEYDSDDVGAAIIVRGAALVHFIHCHSPSSHFIHSVILYIVSLLQPPPGSPPPVNLSRFWLRIHDQRPQIRLRAKFERNRRLNRKFHCWRLLQPPPGSPPPVNLSRFWLRIRNQRPQINLRAKFERNRRLTAQIVYLWENYSANRCWNRHTHTMMRMRAHGRQKLLTVVVEIEHGWRLESDIELSRLHGMMSSQSKK